MTLANSASTASVLTDRPQRYGKQLVSHLGRRATGSWDEATSSGSLDFDNARAELTCTAHSLEITLACAAEDLDRMEDVLGRHLVRFGAKDELTVRWARADGTDGTQQRKDDE
jgi:hypothetical protein